MGEKLSTYDPAAVLVSDEEIAFFIRDALEAGDTAYITHALGVATRAKGMPMWLGKQGFPLSSFTALSVRTETLP